MRQSKSTSSLSQIAYERIQSMLLRSQIASGAKISEEKLALELGISRTPIREAVRRLQLEGLVQQRPSSGTYVASPDRRSLIETYEVRIALESFAVRKAARRMTDEQMAELENYCHDMLRAIRAFRDSGKPVLDGAHLRDFLVADLSFHMLLMKAADNSYMQKLLGDVHVRNRIFGHHSHQRDLSHVAWVWLYHARVAQAIRRRHAAKARYWLVRHMKISLRAALSKFDRQSRTSAAESGSERTIQNLLTSCGNARRSKPEHEKIPATIEINSARRHGENLENLKVRNLEN